jgi:membrane-associated protein
MNIDLSTLVLGWVIDYGGPMVAGLLMLGAMGVPVPGLIVVIAAGAFIRQELLSLYTAPIWGLVGVVAGDTVVYGAGRFTSKWVERRFGESAAWQSAKQNFDKRGGLAIYLTRWLITPLAIPTNLIAGSSRYPFGRFLFFDVAGEITWILLYGGLGYIFGDQWDLITELFTNFSGLIMSILVIAVGVYLLVRYSRRPQPAEVARRG